MTKPTAQAETPEGEAKAKVGRPSMYSEELAEAICERLAQGEPMARICDDEDMPAFRTVLKWEANNPEFGRLSSRAREMGTHYMADDCIRIADETGPDPAEKRIRIDTRIRLIGKWNRKIYGDKQQHEHTGKDGGPIQYADLSALTDDELRKLNEVLGGALLASGSGEGAET